MFEWLNIGLVISTVYDIYKWSGAFLNVVNIMESIVLTSIQEVFSYLIIKTQCVVISSNRGASESNQV